MARQCKFWRSTTAVIPEVSERNVWEAHFIDR